MRVAPKGQRVRLKGETSSERVLEVAATLFRTKGYLSTSIREIAQAAGMKSGSLYYHYASKEVLLDAVMILAVRKLFEEVSRAIERTPPSAPFKDRLVNAVSAHLRVIHQHADLVIASRQSLDALPSDRRAEHVRLRSNYARVWRQLLQAGKESGDVAPNVDVVLVEMFVLGALNWTSEWLDPSRTTYERLSEALVQLVLNGVQGPQAANLDSGLRRPRSSRVKLPSGDGARPHRRILTT